MRNGTRKVIRDPIHGYINVEGFAMDLLDTVEMQRLRRIRQLGFSYLVYPGANHTRFEHSLGVFHLADVLTSQLGMEEDRDEILAAALIHDIGHGPYSHVTEPLLKKYAGICHEDIDDILRGYTNTRAAGSITGTRTVAEVLEDRDINVRDVLSLVKGERMNNAGTILKGEIDVDKMDYLVRDAYYTGVAYGVIDNMRLIQGISLYNGEIVLTKKGITPAEYLIFSRFIMYPSVYNHHTTRIAQLMFIRAMEVYVEERVDDVAFFANALRMMDDCEANVLLRNAGGFPCEMMNRINERNLFKRAFYRPVRDVRADLMDDISDGGDRVIRELENEIARRAGLDDARFLILDVQRRERVNECAVKVYSARSVNGRSASDGLKRLSDVSSLVRMVEHALNESYNVGVYTTDEYRDAVRNAAEAILC
ncbi:MAG: HD domain-containing protein [Canidatus Methanoxibalbensis ujae]|nr:HD domain-containing protein [Candidatus Methanoxibalbensis ujae]MCW7078149.1 HD domain-containing protein [Candidatus Methanoxibalbensis ujae]